MKMIYILSRKRYIDIKNRSQNNANALHAWIKNISPNINEISDSPDPDEAVVYHPTSKILANAGYHNMSKAMKEIFDT